MDYVLTGYKNMQKFQSFALVLQDVVAV